MCKVTTDEHDAGREQRSDDASRPGPGPRWRRSHPAATRGKCLCGDRKTVLTELGRVSPETILRGQKGTAPTFVPDVVEFASKFDHRPRGYRRRVRPGCRPPLASPPGFDESHTMTHVLASAEGDNWLELTTEPLGAERALAWAQRPSCGAVACFVGTVRDHAEGRTGVQVIDYEAYTSQVLPRFEAIASSARERWPDLARIVVWHRVGRVELGEVSVVVAVSTPHRAEAFEACRYVIDTLKATTPIWKRETWEGGTDWSPAARPVEPAPRAGRQ